MSESSKNRKNSVSPCRCVLFQFKCTGIQLIVLPLCRNEFIMCTTFNDMTMIQNNNDIGVFDGRKTMGNDEYGSAIHQSVHTSLDNLLCSCIDGGSRFIHDHNRRICYSTTCNGKQLTLTLRKG